MVYRIKSGARIKTSEEAVTTALADVEARHGGVIRPSDVVEYARPKRSPIHAEFTWDDTEAAEKYREDEARKLIRCVVIVDEENPKADGARAYVCVERPLSEEEPARAYVPLSVALQDPDDREYILQAARSDLDAWRRKYNTLAAAAKAYDAALAVLDGLE